MHIAGWIGCLISGLILLLRPEITTAAVREGLLICSDAIIPSLLPFSIIINILLETAFFQTNNTIVTKSIKYLFHLPAQAAPILVIGNLAGFPLGAKTTLKLYQSNELSKETAEQLLMFCSNAGPAFIFGVIGAKVFSSPLVAFCLWIIHIAGAILIGIALRPKETLDNNIIRPKCSKLKASSIIVKSIVAAGHSVFKICVFVVVFSILTAHLQSVLPPIWQRGTVFAFLIGAIELSKGSILLSDLTKRTAFIAGSVLLAWNGLCIHCQVLSELDGTNISAKKYCIGKMLHVLISAAIACVIAPILPYSN